MPWTGIKVIERLLSSGAGLRAEPGPRPDPPQQAGAAEGRRMFKKLPGAKGREEIVELWALGLTQSLGILQVLGVGENQ